MGRVRVRYGASSPRSFSRSAQTEARRRGARGDDDGAGRPAPLLLSPMRQAPGTISVSGPLAPAACLAASSEVSPTAKAKIGFGLRAAPSSDHRVDRGVQRHDAGELGAVDLIVEALLEGLAEADARELIEDPGRDVGARAEVVDVDARALPADEADDVGRLGDRGKIVRGRGHDRDPRGRRGRRRCLGDNQGRRRLAGERAREEEGNAHPEGEVRMAAGYTVHYGPRHPRKGRSAFIGAPSRSHPGTEPFHRGQRSILQGSDGNAPVA